jgi:hypothetical protein
MITHLLDGFLETLEKEGQKMFKAPGVSDKKTVGHIINQTSRMQGHAIDATDWKPGDKAATKTQIESQRVRQRNASAESIRSGRRTGGTGRPDQWGERMAQARQGHMARASQTATREGVATRAAAKAKKSKSLLGKLRKGLKRIR